MYEALHEIDDIIYDLLWDGKIPKLAAKVLRSSIKCCGEGVCLSVCENAKHISKGKGLAVSKT